MAKLHLGIALHGQNPQEQGGAEAVMLWLPYRRSAVLSPLQAKRLAAPYLIYSPPDLNMSLRNRESSVTNCVGG